MVLERGIPSKHESLTHADYVPALYRPDQFLIFVQGAVSRNARQVASGTAATPSNCSGSS